MQENQSRDLWVGLFVALGLAALTLLALNVSNLLSLPAGKGYVVSAEFDNIGGLKYVRQLNSAVSSSVV